MITAPDNACPLCRHNGLLKEEVMAQADGVYLIKAYNSPGNFLIIPDAHIESLAELPDEWWRAVKSLLPKITSLGDHYNVSVNIGQHAGQTIKHVHFWVIPRAGDKPSSGKGFARFITEADSQPESRNKINKG